MTTSHRASTMPAGGEPAPSDRAGSRGWLLVSAVEAIAATAAILRDLVIPSLVLLAMAAVSLLLRHEGAGSLGLQPFTGRRLVGKMFGFAIIWSVFQLSVTMPIANHVSGAKQDLSAFEDLHGNVGMLAALLLLGWVLGAFIEEFAYRGYLLTRIRESLRNGRVALVVAVVVSSALFGFTHSEQGSIGVIVVTIDGIYFSVLRLRYKTLWASVLAHGFNNTIGFIAFYLVGPLYGLW